MKTIQSSNGGLIIVDAEDYDLLTKWKWQVSKMGYATRATNIGGRTPDKGGTGRRVLILMHRFIMGLECGGQQDRNRIIHHINGNKLDNRKENLEVTSQKNNARAAAGLSKRNTSGFKGVGWSPRVSKWLAVIVVDGKLKQLGVFHDPKMAARAYDTAAMTYFGSYAVTNESLGLLDPYERWVI